MFNGHMKSWRLLDNESYNEEYCSYLVQPKQQPVPMKPNNSTPFGPFVWFGMKRNETDKYGPCQFEFNFASVLKAYQTCRSSQHKICYRAAGTLVYRQEVCHIVMICCLEDEQCRNYPLITGNNTCYFKPPNPLSDTTGPPVDLQFQTTINEYQRRHEHVTFALYLPNSRSLYLSYRDGKIRLTPHNTYCIASRGSECLYKEDHLPISISKLKMIARWLSHEGEDKEPAVEYTVLDQSLEDSFDWFSSADDTEYYGEEGDHYDWDNFEDYDELGFEDFDDEQNDSVNDSTGTTFYDSSSSSTAAYGSEDYD